MLMSRNFFDFEDRLEAVISDMNSIAVGHQGAVGGVAAADDHDFLGLDL